MQQGICRECVGPSENSGVLAKVALRVAAYGLIVRDIGLLEIGTGAHQQQPDGVILSCAPVELSGGTGAFAKIEELLWFGRIEVAARSEAVDEEIVTEPTSLAAIVSIEIEIIDGSTAEIHVPVAAKLGARACGDIENATEAIAVFGAKPAGHEVDGFENLRADSGRKLRLGIVQEGYAVNELVQGKFRAADGVEIVVAIAGAGHQIVDEVVGGFHDWIGEPLGDLVSKRVGTAGLFGIDGEIFGANFHAFLYRLFFL